MLVYGSLTGEAICVGTDPRFILAGHRILEVFWLGSWLQGLDKAAQRNLFGEIVTLMREGVLVTSAALTSWLLIKKRDPSASDADVTLQERSVISGKRLGEARLFRTRRSHESPFQQRVSFVARFPFHMWNTCAILRVAF